MVSVLNSHHTCYKSTLYILYVVYSIYYIHTVKSSKKNTYCYCLFVYCVKSIECSKETGDQFLLCVHNKSDLDSVDI